VQGSNFYCLKQVRTKYVVASLEKEIRIFDVAAGAVVRNINTQQTFDFFHRINSEDYNFEYGIEAEACIGYSYKDFYECGITVNKGPLLEDF
jgi:hypothetical protein